MGLKLARALADAASGVVFTGNCLSAENDLGLARPEYRRQPAVMPEWGTFAECRKKFAGQI